MTFRLPMRLGFFMVTLAALFTWAAAARAQGETSGTEATPSPAASGRSGGGLLNVSSGPFGDQGQVVISIAGEGDYPFRFSKTGDDSWDLALRPSLDYFIKQSVSVGGLFHLDNNGGSSTVGVGLRAGFSLPLGSLVSLWIRGGLSYDHTSYSNDATPSRSVTRLGVGVPFLFHLVPHFFLGVGPFMSVPLTDSEAMAGKAATFGLSAIVGGYF